MQNKLAKIEGTNFTYRFLYNSRNERIAIGKSVNAAEMTWRYDACNGPVTIAEFKESADVDTYFVRGSGIAQGIGDVIAEVNYDGTSEEIHYYLYNHRGDVVCVVNPGSTPNTTYRYDAYGRCYENYGSYTSRYTFSTKEYLPDANLYLYQYRVYDPQAGRWTQRDPIDYQDSINLYQFCGNNPVNNIDEYGWEDEPTDEKKKMSDDDIAEIVFHETSGLRVDRTGKVDKNRTGTDEKLATARKKIAGIAAKTPSRCADQVKPKEGEMDVYNKCLDAAKNRTEPGAEMHFATVPTITLADTGKIIPNKKECDKKGIHSWVHTEKDKITSVYGPFYSNSGKFEGQWIYIIFYSNVK